MIQFKNEVDAIFVIFCQKTYFFTILYKLIQCFPYDTVEKWVWMILGLAVEQFLESFDCSSL